MKSPLSQRQERGDFGPDKDSDTCYNGREPGFAFRESSRHVIADSIEASWHWIPRSRSGSHPFEPACSTRPRRTCCDQLSV